MDYEYGRRLSSAFNIITLASATDTPIPANSKRVVLSIVSSLLPAVGQQAWIRDTPMTAGGQGYAIPNAGNYPLEFTYEKYGSFVGEQLHIFASGVMNIAYIEVMDQDLP